MCCTLVQPADGGAGEQRKDADRAVLAVQVGLGACLDRRNDLLHSGIDRRQGQDGAAGDDAVEHRHRAAYQREPQARIRGC